MRRSLALCRTMARLPVLPTLQGYKLSWLTADITAGLTLVAIVIPEQMATAHLANMPAVAGFYAFIAGSLLFALFGRHPRMSVGGDSTIAPVFAAGSRSAGRHGLGNLHPSGERDSVARRRAPGGCRAAQARLDR